MPIKLFSIAFFGLLGVYSRYFIGLQVAKFFSHPFPIATFLINIIGAFFIGIIYVLGIERSLISNHIVIGLMVGFLGGFTTFSSYCLEAVHLLEESKYLYAIVYLGLSPFVGIVVAIAGIALTRALIGTSG